MQFISFITLFVGLILYPALTLASCEFKRYGARNQTALATCVSNFNTEPSHVDDSECGGAKWFLLLSAWSSTEDCYNLCGSCLSSGIAANASAVTCRQQKLFAVCHVGYF
ncbi:hypothetical protein Pst134EA_000818 [Puccinia striiformis f. sp. tritici]|uniref:Uncharacterized protein n=1 Tax=Puccinia striiformis TaxID=27350 RepID=A0A2S4VZG2_9BASI|nr:hypothetical protein Pst134EA_000818 [Puccinia striiformis f. sp. tritici]KAH9466988.1 hypothetical protein Pst134EB_002023 [Puccinia striiformis f. sp. tritici]KAH9473746.1 hypothetical protein Pst134EA_000818 [Puccinia striiformis f. sp. tritici]KAI9600968.1 hypothetical protein H4Q26_000762 [Puccinia striiformis f. sp. tritici PST-130]POW14915.1 hypothetical protein PSTT_02565 [Puccinia striiformis]